MSRSFHENIHVLIPRDDLQSLRRRARSEKKSVGELIRQAVRAVCGAAEPHRRRQAFERLIKRDELVMEDWDLVKKDLLRRYE